MSDKKYDAFKTDDNKIRLDLTQEEYNEITKKGFPHGLRYNIIKNKPKTRSDNADDETIFGHKRSELSDEEIDMLRRRAEEEAEERQNDD